ncbi:MAG: hypothetical protein JWN60_882 [Acidobacteria bacterium]|jgi:hypothetical protein|nr:hypothetical protein [Acidobacteriota bacterium]
MTIAELKKELEKYPDDIELYAAPIIWVDTVDNTSAPVRNVNVFEKHKIEMLKLLQFVPDNISADNPEQFYAIFGFESNITFFEDNELFDETDSVN